MRTLTNTTATTVASAAAPAATAATATAATTAAAHAAARDGSGGARTRATAAALASPVAGHAFAGMPVHWSGGVIQMKPIRIVDTLNAGALKSADSRSYTVGQLEAMLDDFDDGNSDHVEAKKVIDEIVRARKKKRKRNEDAVRGWTLEESPERAKKIARRRSKAVEQTFLDPGRGVGHQALATSFQTQLEASANPVPTIDLEGQTTQHVLKGQIKAMQDSLTSQGQSFDTFDPKTVAWGAPSAKKVRGKPRQKFRRGGFEVNQQRKPSSANIGNLSADAFGDFGRKPGGGKHFSLDITDEGKSELGFASDAELAREYLTFSREGRGFTEARARQPKPAQTGPAKKYEAALKRSNALAHHMTVEEPLRFHVRGAEGTQTNADRQQPALTGVMWGLQSVASGTTGATMGDIFGKSAPKGPTAAVGVANKPSLFDTPFDAVFGDRQRLAATRPNILATLLGGDAKKAERLTPLRKAIRKDLHDTAGGESDLEDDSGYTSNEEDDMELVG